MPLQLATAAGASVQPTAFRYKKDVPDDDAALTPVAAIPGNSVVRYSAVTGQASRQSVDSGANDAFNLGANIPAGADTAVGFAGRISVTVSSTSARLRLYVQVGAGGFINPPLLEETLQRGDHTLDFSGSAPLRGNTDYRLVAIVDQGNGSDLEMVGAVHLFVAPKTAPETVDGVGEVDFIYLATGATAAKKVWRAGGIPEITSFTLAPARFRSEASIGANRITARWAITGATTSRWLTQDNLDGNILRIPLANDATSHAGLTIPRNDAVYRLHAANEDGTDVEDARFLYLKNAAISSFTSHYRGQYPQPGGAVVAQWDLSWSVVGHPRPALSLTADDRSIVGNPAPHHTHYSGDGIAEVGAGSYLYSVNVVQGRSHTANITLTARAPLADGAETGYIGLAERTITLRTGTG